MAITILDQNDKRELQEQIDDVQEQIDDAVDKAKATPTDSRYFDIDVDGVVSLKPEYRGDSLIDAYPYSISDNGKGVAGSKNSELPEVVIIPQNINGEEVTGFQKGMFCNNKRVKEIVIPSYIKTIPNGFVREAIYLEKLTPTEQVESVGTGAFQYTRLIEVLLPNLKTLGNQTFQNASCLRTVDFGSITNIPKQTFYQCENLYDVRADKITSIGSNAFYGTRRLKNLPFLTTVTSIGSGAFWSSRCDLESLPTSCTFEDNACCYKNWNTSDYWTGIPFDVCKNPLGSLFHQKDPRWADKEIKYTDKNGKLWTYVNDNGNPCTFGANGCALVVLTEIYSAFYGVQFNSPEEIFPVLEDAGVLGLNFRYKDAWCQIANGLGLETEYVSTMTSDNLRKVYDALKDGALLYRSTVGSTTADGGHAMLGYGINSNGEMLTADSSMHCYEIGIYENHKTAWHVYKHGNQECDCVIVKKRTSAT